MVAITAGAGVAGAPDPATSSTPGVELELGGEGRVNALGGQGVPVGAYRESH